jgi:hypothetical protein
MSRPLTPTEQALADILSELKTQRQQQDAILTELRRLRLGLSVLADTDLEQEEPTHAI